MTAGPYNRGTAIRRDTEGWALRARRRWLILALAAVLSIGAAPSAASAARSTATPATDRGPAAVPSTTESPGARATAARDPRSPAVAAGGPVLAPVDEAPRHDDHLPAARAHFRAPTAAELAALGFVPGTGACAGAFSAFPRPAVGDPGRRDAAIDGDTCTHGPDILDVAPGAPPPSDPGATVFGSETDPTYAGPESIPCYTTGPYVHVFYGYLSGGTNRLAALKPKILQSVSVADDIYARSAGQVGRVRHVRWKMSSCQLVIDAVPLSATVLNQAYPGPIRTALVNAGKMATTEKGLIFTDESVCFGGIAGIAEVQGDTTAASTNRNNKGNLLARVMACAWTSADMLPYAGEVAAHEVTHTMGAVQNDAPNASYRTGGSFHCTDGDDVMCYDDGGGAPRAICAVAYPQYLDCRKDDYFSPVPAAGSYIATHWNTANNQFLAAAAAPSVQALAHPTASLTSPAASGQVSGILNLTATAATASDGAGILQVEFWAGHTLVDIDPTAPYTAQVDTRFSGTLDSPTGWPNGTQLKVVALAVDTHGRVVPSAVRTLDVENPSVHFTTPAPYASVSTATVQWTAAAASGSALPISKVEVLNGGTVVATDTSSPYSGTVPLDVGVNHLTVRVTDSRGTTRDSGTRYVTRIDSAPTATMLWPGSGLSPTVVAGVTQTLWATGTVASGRTVSKAEFLIDGTPLPTAPTKVGLNWKLNWAPPTGGVFNSVTFRLTDSASAVVTSDPTGFQVLDAPASSHPSISLTSPTANATVNGATTLTANVAVPAGLTAREADFYINGALVGQALNPTGVVSYSWTNSGISGPAFFSAQVSADDGVSIFDTVDSLPVLATITAPTTFAITSPANGASLKGDVNVTASISHPEFLQADPELWLAGDFNDILFGPTYSTTLSTQYENGTTSIQLRGTLAGGTPIASPALTVHFANSGISQTVPTAGATVTSRINLAAIATGTYEVGIEEVRFRIDGVMVGRDSYAPYAVAWDPATVATGSHTTTVEMLMTDGSLVTAPSRSFTVARTPVVTRLAGTDRYATAAAISRNSFAPGVPAVYIATGLSFPDALAGAAVAGHVGAPLLLVPGTSIPAVVATELTRLKPAKIVVLGGTGVVSDGVKAALVAYL